MSTAVAGPVRGRLLSRVARLLGGGRPRADFKVVTSAEAHGLAHAQAAPLRERWAAEELALIPPGEPAPFQVAGFCGVCDRGVDFQVDFRSAWARTPEGRLLPNWRESLICPSCGLPNRLRASHQIFRDVSRPRPGAAVYMTEQVTPLFRLIAEQFPGTIGSEFLSDGTAPGQANARGIRHEDLTRLTFRDGQFDHILSFEVLEHVPDYRACLRECARVLKPGGSLLLTAPFNGQPATTVRARLLPDGEIEHILPPEYHGDPVGDGKGCLAFHVFGWDLADDLRAAGFGRVECYLCRDRALGYLGGWQPQFVAWKA